MGTGRTVTGAFDPALVKAYADESRALRKDGIKPNLSPDDRRELIVKSVETVLARHGESLEGGPNSLKHMVLVELGHRGGHVAARHQKIRREVEAERAAKTARPSSSKQGSGSRVVQKTDASKPVSQKPQKLSLFVSLFGLKPSELPAIKKSKRSLGRRMKKPTDGYVVMVVPTHLFPLLAVS